VNVTKDRVDGVISLNCLVDSGVAVFDPEFIDHLPCLDYLHLPLDPCPLIEVAHLLDFHPHHLEPVPHLG
jgi:hypothetical protein